MDWLIRDVLVLAFHPRYVYRIFFHSMVMATCIFPLFFAGGNNKWKQWKDFSRPWRCSSSSRDEDGRMIIGVVSLSSYR